MRDDPSLALAEYCDDNGLRLAQMLDQTGRWWLEVTDFEDTVKAMSNGETRDEASAGCLEQRRPA